MNIRPGRDVPNDDRTNAENSLNSDQAGAAGSHNLRSPAAAGPARLRFGRYVLDLERGCLLAGDEEISLRPKTFEFLRYLASNPGRLVSKDELLAAVWPNVVVTEDSLFQCVAELRRALADEHLIKTVARRGYRFDVAVEPCGPQPADPLLLSVTRGEPPTAGKPAGRRAIMLATIGAFGILAAALGATWWWLGPRDHPSLPPSIMVLPLHNLGGDPEQDYVAAGITADLTTDLSRLPGAIVIAHATALTLKGRTVDARQVGRDFNVRYLLEGSVHRSGDEIRVNVQLIDAGSGAHLWAERFEREREQVAAWQNEIVGRIANTLNLRLTRLESDRIVRERRNNPEAYDLTTRGWALVYTAKKPETYEVARVLFKQALALDPKAVNAVAGLAWSSAVLVLNAWSEQPAQDFAAAEAAAAQTLAIDPNNVVAHHVRGFLLRLQARPGAARDAFRTVVALDPNFAAGHGQLGVTELEVGRPEETFKAVERAIRLSPRDPNVGHWFSIAGLAELHLGRFAESAAWFARAVETDTGTPTVRQRAYFASALALAGRTAEARAALAELLKAKPTATIASLRAAERSTEPSFLARQERVYEGLRLVGLPE
jgi:TolB-like protein/DNA-binding winged helix-turn-helix (wHTH) protein/Tfp pilus assembly protein PilF